MRKLALTIVAISVASQAFAATEEIVWGESTNVLPHSLQTSPFQAKGLINTIAPQPKGAYTLKLVNSDKEQTEHARYQLYYLDIPIWGHQLIYHKKNNQPPLVTGVQVSDIEKDVTNTKGQLSPEEIEAKIKAKFKTPIKFKSTKKIIFIDDNKTAHLAYHVAFYTNAQNSLISAPNYIIDANDGAILKEWNQARTERQGQGLGGNAITLPYRAGLFQYGDALPNLPSLGKFDVQEILGRCYVQNDVFRVVNLENANLGYEAYPITPEAEDKLDLKAYSYPCDATSLYLNYSDGHSGPVNLAFSPVNDTMYFAQTTFDMYQKVYGFKKPFGKDLPIRAYTHIGKLDNAFAIPTISEDGMLLAHQQIVIGNGEHMLTAPTQSVIAHELSHLFTDQHSGLIYDGQTGAINEAFSDMAAIALNHYIKKSHPWYWDGKDWTIGREAILSGEPLRYMDDPKKDGLSIDHVSEYNDSLNVHFTSGIFNKAFYLLAHKPGWNVQRAFRVMADANAKYWSPIAYFDFAACGVIQAAIDRHLNKKEVIEAFAEVGVVCPMHKEA